MYAGPWWIVAHALVVEEKSAHEVRRPPTSGGRVACGIGVMDVDNDRWLMVTDK